MIVIADKPGQLGNMLFLFSHFIGRALESDFSVANPAFSDYAKYFPKTRDDLFSRFPARKSLPGDRQFLRNALYKTSHYAARALAKLGGRAGPLRAITLRDWSTVYPLDAPEFLNMVRPGRLIFARGWMFRDHPSFEKHADTIRDFFQPLEEHRINVRALIERARKDTDVLIGVHIRHGIIYFDNAKQYWYEPAKYAEMMGKVEALFPGKRVTFLICSDKKQDAQVFSQYNFFFGNDHLIEDMYSFAECDYIFGPPSTYTMWASFYGGVPLYLVREAEWEPAIEDFEVESGGRIKPLDSDGRPEKEMEAAAQ